MNDWPGPGTADEGSQQFAAWYARFQEATVRLDERYPSLDVKPERWLFVPLSVQDHPLTLRRQHCLGPAGKVAVPDEQDVLAALYQLRFAREAVDAAERRLIAMARARGLSWPEIAEAQQMNSSQAAQQRARRIGQPEQADPKRIAQVRALTGQ